jgi:hypothetical protein
MAPEITLYILGGCVALAALLFIIMIVLSVARPPRLPVLSTYEPPLQRMVRALTPLPIAAAAFDEAPTKLKTPARPIPPRPPPMSANVQARSMPAVPAPAAPFVAPPIVAPVAPSPVAPAAPSAFVWNDHSPPPLSTQNRLRVDPKRAVSRPQYPVRRSRKLLWFVLALFMTSALAVGAVVAYPALLNPLCDDYEWFGADAARDVRQRARDTHAAIADFVLTL